MISRSATVILSVFLLAAASLSCNGAAEDATLPLRTIETQALPLPTQITKPTQRPEPMQLPQPQQRIWPNVTSRSVSFRFVDPPSIGLADSGLRHNSGGQFRVCNSWGGYL